MLAVGGITFIMFLIRFVLFTIYESPKYNMGKGNDEEAVRIVHEVARRNGKSTTLTVEDLKACEVLGNGQAQRTDASAAIKRKLQSLNLTHVRSLFATKKLALSTGLIMAIWAFIGLGYPYDSIPVSLSLVNFTNALIRLYNAYLPYLQAIRGAEFGDGSTYITYRNSAIIAVLGIPGALLGGAMVEIKSFGRKGTLALSTVLTGVFLYCSTTARTSDALLGWNCAYNFTSNIMYAVLYAYTPEVSFSRIRTQQ